MAFADGRSESVGESRSRVAIHRAGLEPPTPQWAVLGVTGRLVGRVDFGWPPLRAVGEFDGCAKYGRFLGPGQAPADVVIAEKLREDRLRDEGLRVVRWTWSELDTSRSWPRGSSGRLRGADDVGARHGWLTTPARTRAARAEDRP